MNPIKLWSNSSELNKQNIKIWAPKSSLGFLLKLCTPVFRGTNLANLQTFPKLPQPLLLLNPWPICPPWWEGELESTSAYCRFLFSENTPYLTSKDEILLWATKKKRPYFPLYWLFKRDPFNGLLQPLYNWVGFHPLYNLTNQGLFIAHMTSTLKPNHAWHGFFLGGWHQYQELSKQNWDIFPQKYGGKIQQSWYPKITRI